MNVSLPKVTADAPGFERNARWCQPADVLFFRSLRFGLMLIFAVLFGEAKLSATVPSVTSSGTKSGTVGSALSYQITATNTPTSFDATNLPSGLSVNTSTGLISGTPTAAATTSVTVKATNSHGTGTKTLTLTINKGTQPAVSITSASSLIYGNAYTASASGGAGTGAIVWALGTGSTATGAAINSSTGVITASSIGKVVIKAYRASDSNYNQSTTTANFTITITPRPVTVTLSGSKVYDGTTALTGASASITSGTLAGSDTINYTFNAAPSANGGTYPAFKPLVLATDNFNRADANPISGNWGQSGVAGPGLKLVSNAAVGAPNPYDSSALENSLTWPANQFAEAAITTAGGDPDDGTGGGVVVRGTIGGETGYYAIIQASGSNNLWLITCVNGSWTHVGYTVSYVAGALLRLEVSGTQLNVWYNGTLVGTVSDSTISSGRPGLYISQDGSSVSTVDDFKAGNPAGTSDLVTATITNSSNYVITYAGAYSITAPAAQSAVTITSSSTGIYGIPYTATASGGNGTGAIIWSLGTGSTAAGAAINASTGVVTANSTGTVVIKAYRAGDSTYAASATTADFTVTFGSSSSCVSLVGAYGASAGGTVVYSSVTIPGVMTSGANRLLMVSAVTWGEGGSAISGITFGGASFTKLTSGVWGEVGDFETWYLLNPTATTGDVVISYSSGPTEYSVSVSAFSNVNQVSPFGAVAAAYCGTTSSATVSPTSSASDLLVFFGATDDWGVSMSGSAGLSRVIEKYTFSFDRHAMFVAPGGTASGTITGGHPDWGTGNTAAVGVALHSACESVAQSAVTITSSSTGIFGIPYTATASGGNGTGAIVWALGTGSTASGAAINASTGAITANSTGTVVIKAYRAGDSSYAASATTADFTVTFGASTSCVSLVGAYGASAGGTVAYTTATIPGVMTSGANRLLVVSAVSWAEGCGTISGITFGGACFTKLSRGPWAEVGDFETWYLLNPSTTTGDVVVTYTSGQTEYSISVSAYSGVNQVAPFGTVAAAYNGASPSATVCPASTAGDLLVFFGATDDWGVNLSGSTGLSQVIERYSYTFDRHAMFIAPGGTASGTITGGHPDWGDGNTAAVGVAIHSACETTAQCSVTITSPSTGTYGTPYTATASGGNGTGAIVWALGTGSTAAGAAINSSTGAITASSVGKVVIKAYRAGDTTYAQSATTADFTVTIAPRPITVTLSGSKAYDGTTALTGASASITSGSLVGSDVINYTFNVTPSAASGSYPAFKPLTLAVDNFNRADANPLDGGWVQNPAVFGPGIKLVSNAAVGAPHPYDSAALESSQSCPADQFAEAAITTTGGYQDNGAGGGVIVRGSKGGATGYYAIVQNSGTNNLWLITSIDATWTEVAYTVPYVAGAVLRLEARGTLLSVWYNGTFVGSVTDSTLSSGQPGLYVSQDSSSFSSIDDFSAGALAGASDLVTATVTNAFNYLITYAGSYTITAASPPAVSLTSPANGSTYTAPGSFTLAANASDSDGSVTKVEFFQGTTKLGESTSAPYSFNVTGLAAGSYSYFARATDNSGTSADSTSVSVTVTNPNQPPVVSLTSPANGSTYPAPGSFTLAANASDSDGSVTKVEFFQGTAKIGESTTAPYGFSVTGLAAGSYSYSARATDNSGATTTSSSVGITVTNPSPPTVSLTAPTSGSTFIAPATFKLRANAAAGSPGHSITKVEYFQGTVKIGENVMTAVWEFNIIGLGVGSYVYTARATDDTGATASSALVFVTVTNGNTPPTVSITAPSTGASYSEPASFSIAATASDSDGSISKVEFLQNGTKIGETSTSPYSFAVTALAAGNYSYVARATDNSGATTNSTAVAITVVANTPPTVTLTAPTDGSSVVAPAAVTLTATANDSDGTIARVEFYQGTTLLGQSTTAPYSFTTSALSAGTYAFSAKAFDNLGANAVSATSTITVVNPNQPPTVALTAPTNGAQFIAPASITLAATAADSDGTVTKVEFFNGFTKIGESLTAPYQFSWSGVVAGNYTLTARATDNTGATVDSAAIAITVTANTPPSVSLTAPSNGTVFAPPASISLAASASDADGSVAKVEFFSGAAKIGEASGAPFSSTWSNVTSGDYTLTARATDNLGATTTSAAVTITVNATPVANPQSVSTSENGSLPIVLTGSDLETAAASLVFTVVTQPSHGTFTGIAPNLTYVPTTGYSGTDSFTFKVNDGRLDSATATITINVTAGNHSPVATGPASVTTAEDTPIEVTLTATDQENSSLIYTITALPQHGTLSGTAPNLTYLPALNYNGSDSLTFKVNDGSLDSTLLTVPITVTPVNDIPVADPQTVTVATGTPKAITLTGSDVETAAASLGFTVVANPTHGTLSGTAPNLTYTSTPDFGGFDSFTFTVNDGSATSLPATVQLTTGLPPRSRTYTTTDDFTSGTLTALVTTEPDQLSNKTVLSSYDAVWIANSSKGTIVKIDPETARVTGEYNAKAVDATSPYPSRIAVDSKGDVWVANMSQDSIVKIGLPENGHWVDRNGNGQIDTSGSLGDVRDWDVDNINFAKDEAILLYVHTGVNGVRHLSIDKDDNVWVGGANGPWQKYNGRTGELMRTEPSLGIGGSGGFMAFNGLLYSAGTNFLVWDTNNPIAAQPLSSAVREGAWASALDSKGNLWVTKDWTSTVIKYAPDGTMVGEYYHGEPWAMGIAIDANDDVWVAHSHCGHSVGHLNSNGLLLGNVEVSNHGPVEVSVDRHGRIWVASSTGVVDRINPVDGPLGADGVTRVGKVDLTTGNLGGALWTYGRFTGNANGLASANGTWTFVYDGALSGSTWGPVVWNALLSNDGNVTVEGALSADGVTYGPYQPLTFGHSAPTGTGRFLKIRTSLISAATGESPVLYDLSVGTEGYVPPAVPLTWSVFAGDDITGNCPEVIQLKGSFRHTVQDFPVAPTYAWSVISAPAPDAVEPFDTSQLRPKVKFKVQGNYVLRLTATLNSVVSTSDLKVALVPYNRPPYVNAGYTTFHAEMPSQLWLWGDVKDDGLPSTNVTSHWSKLFGPGSVTFADPAAPATSATFSAPGVYVLQLTATDGELTSNDVTTVWLGYSCIPPAPAGLVSWWQASGNGDDHVGGNQAFTEKGADFAEGKLGGAFRFDGFNDRVRIFAAPSLDVGAQDGLGLEFWINPGSSRIATIFEYGSIATRGFNIKQNNAQLDVDFREIDGTPHLLSVADALPTATWTHVAVTYDKASGEARVYVNGLLRKYQAIGSVTLATNLDVNLGGRQAGTEPFEGLIDEVSVYNRAIYADEITTIVTNPAGKRPPVSNLAPVVSAGPALFNKSVNVPVALNGVVTDDGQPIDGVLSAHWSKLSGPGSVSFGNAAAAQTTATFSDAGIYLLELAADDGGFCSRSTVEVRVDSLYKVEPDSSIAAWWPFNADDFDAIHGIKMERMNGASLVTDGQVARAVRFNGVNQYSRTNADPRLNIGASATGMTIEFWLKPERVQNSQTILAWGSDTTTNGVRIVQSNNSPYGLTVYVRDVAGPDNQINLTGALANDTWQHLAVTYDKTTGVARVYLNGNLWQENYFGVFTPQTALPLTFGGSLVQDGVNFYQGSLDEVTLYTRPLSVTEIAAIYTAGAVGKATTDNNAPPTVNAGPDIAVSGTTRSATLVGQVTDDGRPVGGQLSVAWSKVSGPGTVNFANPASVSTGVTFSAPGVYVLRLDADDGLNRAAGDTMVANVGVSLVETLSTPPLAAWWPGNGDPHEVVHGNHDIEFYNGAGYAPGKVAQGFVFDGVDDHARIAAHSDLDIGASPLGMTIEFWVKIGRAQDAQNILTWGSKDTNGVRIVQNQNSPGLYVYLRDTNGSDNFIEMNGTLTIGTWQHVATTYDKTTGIARIYLDGELQREKYVGVFTPLTSLPLTFGGSILAGGNYFYQGSLDEVALYARPLTITEIAAIYAAGASGKAPLDGNLPPVVNAGPDVAIRDVAATATLAGTVTDDNKPFGPPAILWSLVDGPTGGTVQFADATAAQTTATFTVPGTYLLKLTATEGYVAPVSDSMEVRVGAATVEPPAGLAAWWPANGHPHEMVHGNHDVELYNGAGYGPGQVSQGFVFDGANDSGRVAAHSDLDIGASPLGLTIECWIKPERTQDNQNILTWGTLDVEGMRVVQHHSFNGLYVYMRDAATNVEQAIELSGDLPLNVWQHLAITYDKTTGIGRIYLNGELRREKILPVITPQTYYPLILGGSALSGGTKFYKGSLDEVTFYTRPLTITEIGAIYAAGVNGKTPLGDNLPPVVNAGPDVAISNIAATATLAGTVTDDNKPFGPPTKLWTLVDAPTGGTVQFADATAAQTTATFTVAGTYLLKLTATDGYAAPVSDLMEVRVGTSPVESPSGLAAWWPGNGHPREVVHGNHDVEFYNGAGYGPGHVSQGFVFDGVNDHARIAAHSDLDIGTSPLGLTIECWVKPGRAGDGQNILTWGTRDINGVRIVKNQNFYGLFVYLTDINGSDNRIELSGDLVLDTWQHLAVTYDKATGRAQVYLNGQYWGGKDLPVFTPRTSLPLTFGGSLLGEGGSSFYQGALDEVTLYTRPLTSTEIAAIYAAGANGKTPVVENIPPTLTFDEPVSGSSLQAGVSTTLVAFASDQDGSIAKVEFFDGVTKLGETLSGDSGQPTRYGFSLPSGLSLGSHVLSARATDSGGAVTLSKSVTVTAVTALPAVALTAPAADATIPAYTAINLTASATYSAGAVAKVEFYDGATKLGESSSPSAGSTYSLTVGAGLAAGSHRLTARAVGADAAVAISPAIHVTGGISSPVVSLTSPLGGATLVAGAPLSLKASATTTLGVIAKVEFFDGATKLGERAVADSVGGSIYTFTATTGLTAGTHNLTAKATASTTGTTTSSAVVVTAGTYTGAPKVTIAQPLDAARISAPVTVSGIVAMQALTNWTLEYRLKAAEGAPVESWVTLATGTGFVGSPAAGSSAAIPGTLGTFDPTRLINGIYELQLRATDASLSTYLENPITVVVEGNMKVGAFTLAFEDLKVPVAGVPISITRTYDSRDPRLGDFGPGWRIAVNNVRVQKNRTIGTRWFQTEQSGIGDQYYYVDPISDPVVTVTMPDGESHRFRAGAYVKSSEPSRNLDPDDASYPAPASTGKVRFYPLGDTTSKLEPIDEDNQLAETFFILGTSFQDLLGSDPRVGDPGEIYNPTRFRLTTKDGTKFIVDERLGLLWLEDLSGNTLILNRDAQDRVTSLVSTLAPSSVHLAPIVTSVTIHRDTTGRVDYIRDPANHDVDYSYDAQGRLSSFANRTLDVTQFKYENTSFPYYLTKIIDPRGGTALRTEFDENGRMVKQIDADGKETTFTHAVDVSGRYEKVKDRLGHESTFFYDERGNVTTKIDPLGAQTTYSYYPDSDWVKFETDHYGNTKSMVYDARGNVTVQTTGASLSENPENPTTGYTTRTSYNSRGAPTLITDPSGRIQSFTYDPTTNNLLTNVVGVGGPAPATTTYHYNTDGTLDTVTDAQGTVTGNSYDYSFSNPSYPSAVKQVTVTVTDAAAHVLRTSRTIYDAQQNMLAQIATRTLPEGGTEDIVTKYIYDSENRLKATIMPDGKVSETRYTSFGQTDKSLLWKSLADYQTGTDSLARVTSYGYDDRGNQTSTTYPDGSSESSHFDLENRRDWSQDKLGRRTSFQYDDVGRLRFTIEPDATPADLTDNPYTETVYDLTGRVTDTYDELRHRTSVVYYPDGTPDAGRRKQSIQVLSTGNLTTSYSYDASGDVRFVTDPRGNTTETRYDDQGRPTTVVYPATDENPATQTTTTYDILGRRVAMTDQEGKVARYRYDALGRLVEVRQYLDQSVATSDAAFSASPSALSVVSTRYSYDELGHQLTQTDARGNSTNYRYDSLGRRTKRILPDNATETVQYDAWGNLWKRTDFKGYTTTFLYDTLNRLTEKDADPTHPSLIYSHAPDKITYGYDAAGNRIDATVEKGSTVLYVEDTPVDERSRRQFKDTPYGKLTYGYYANSLLKNITSSNTDGVHLGYRYDDANRLAYVDDTSGNNSQLRTTNYTYNANGSLETVTAANGIKHTYTYDTLNRLRLLTVGAVALNGPTLASYTYALNPSGHRHQIIEGAKTTTYTYDDLYRLTNEAITGDAHGNTGAVGYSLDKVGNRLSRSSQLSAISAQPALTYNSRDWLAGDTYDANGNTLTSPLTAYNSPLTIPDVYDFEDRLIIRHKPDGSTINLAYDADGLLRQKTILNAASLLVSATGYLIDSNNLTGYAQILEERINTTSGTTVKTYTYGSDLISRTLSTANISPLTAYYVYDGLGSVRGLTNESGSITDVYDYDAFGNLIYRFGTTDNDYLYRGERYESDIGQYYLRARFYNQQAGRFWNQDSYEGSASDPASLHKYFYANANPINGFDPSGHFTLVETMGVTFSVGTLAKIAIVSYLALTITNPWREWTLYSTFTFDSPVGFHAYMYARSKMNQTIRYDIGVDNVRSVLANLLGFHVGYISGQYVSANDVGTGVPVAKLSDRGKAVWERLVVGRPILCDPVVTPFTYNIPLWNCVTWTITASTLAITVSLLPF